jgi:hypothetical protein
LPCEAPFGIVKTSGYGRFGGEAAISGFTKLRWITIQFRPAALPALGKARPGVTHAKAGTRRSAERKQSFRVRKFRCSGRVERFAAKFPG